MKFLLPFLSFAMLLSAEEKPNIVLIYADDLGYGDVQCYNPDRGKIPTPHMDKLAAQGMKFTDAHSSSSLCSPSRYSLLTGRYHWRSKLQKGIVGTWKSSLIDPERLTLGGLARQNGYHTAMAGKWHLGWDWPIPEEERALLNGSRKGVLATEEQVTKWREWFSQDIPGGPTDRGFDRYFGTCVPNWPPYCFIQDRRTVGIPSEFLPARLFNGGRLATIQGPALKDWSLEPILPTITARACEWIGEYAKGDKPFFLYMPLTAPHTPISVNEEWKGKSGINAYADFVMETDAMIGRVLAAIEESGTAENTLVILTSDNGCSHLANIPEMQSKGHFPSGPLRGKKSELWEGGSRVPFIVRWPGRVKPGTISNQLVQQSDLMATFADFLGTKLPDNAGEDSFSLLPLFEGKNQPIRSHGVSCSGSGIPALRQGPWKLMFFGSKGQPALQDKSDQPIQLYNLDNDLGETKNLAEAMPERVAEMKELMEKLITEGRSNPGPKQENDVNVLRYYGK